jgi:prevent-host-death family protein
MDNSYLDGYIVAMTHYSVAEAKNNLPKLLDRMLAGEEVVITRRGKPLGQLQPIAPKEIGVVLDAAFWDTHRVGQPNDSDPVREMRDSYRY